MLSTYIATPGSVTGVKSHDGTQLIHCVELPCLELVAAHCRDGDRDLLQIFFTTPRGDDDIVDRLGVGVCAVGSIRSERGI
jgi:hypothetical protein